MYLELFVISVIVSNGYLAPVLLRRLPPGRRTYGWLLVVNLVIAVIAFAALRSGTAGTAGEALGAVAIGAFVCLVMVPPALRNLSRRALMANRPRIAAWLLEFRELIQPRMGAREERELVDAMIAVRDGKVDEARKLLEASREQLDDQLARRQVDERIAMVLLSARRWQQASIVFEQRLERTPGPLSPPLLIEMVRAYGELGELDRAAQILARLEDTPLAREPVFLLLLLRARLVFLAACGRTTLVDRLLSDEGPLAIMAPETRAFWRGTTRMHAGDAVGAKAALTEAVSLARRDRRAREVAAERLSVIVKSPVLEPRVVSAEAAALADKLAVAIDELMARPRSEWVTNLPPPPRGPLATGALVVVNLAVSLTLFAIFGSFGDLGVLVRAGANVRGAVAEGEWWRLGTSVFLHVGWIHLLVNVYGLWVVGKFIEQWFGRARLLAIYAVAGVAGAWASFALGHGGTSAGASGAIFGLLGAGLVELGVHGSVFPAAWRKSVFRILLFITVAQVVIGFAFEAIDQAAHLGGLVGGGVMGMLLSKNSRWGRSTLATVVAIVVVLAWAAGLGWGTVATYGTNYGDTLSRSPMVARRLTGVEVMAPARWDVEQGTLVDHDLYILFYIGAESEAGTGTEVSLDDALDYLAKDEERLSHQRNFEKTMPAAERWLEMPPGWKSRELVAVADGLGGQQRYRVIVLGRNAPGGGAWLGVLYIPEVLAREVQPVMAAILRSTRAVSTAPAGGPGAEKSDDVDGAR